MIPILMYHLISKPWSRGTPYRGLTVHPARFQRQMQWLHRLGYQGLSMRDLMPYLQGQKQGKVIGITFDDGYANVLENALPILLKYGFTATNYFVVRQIGGSNIWDAHEGVPSSVLMDSHGLKTWSDSGMEVGSHTLNHPVLARLSPELAKNEIFDSKDELEQLTGQPVQAFCYPYGKYVQQTVDLVRQAGYTNATTTERGLVRTDDDLLQLPRVEVRRSTGIFRFLQKCLTSLEDKKRST